MRVEKDGCFAVDKQLVLVVFAACDGHSDAHGLEQLRIGTVVNVKLNENIGTFEYGS